MANIVLAPSLLNTVLYVTNTEIIAHVLEFSIYINIIIILM